MGKCCNPFRTPHKEFVEVYESTPKIRKDARLIDLRIAVNDVICDPCRKRIKREVRKKSGEGTSSGSAAAHQSEEPSELQNTPQQELSTAEPMDTGDVSAAADISSPSEPSEVSEPSEGPKFQLDLEGMEKLNKCLTELLNILGLEPIDISKMRAEKYQDKKLHQMNKTMCEVSSKVLLYQTMIAIKFCCS